MRKITFPEPIASTKQTGKDELTVTLKSGAIVVFVDTEPLQTWYDGIGTDWVCWYGDDDEEDIDDSDFDEPEITTDEAEDTLRCLDDNVPFYLPGERKMFMSSKTVVEWCRTCTYPGCTELQGDTPETRHVHFPRIPGVSVSKYSLPYPKFEDEVRGFCDEQFNRSREVREERRLSGSATSPEPYKWQCPGCGVQVSLSGWGMEVRQHVKECKKVAECPAYGPRHDHKCPLCKGKGFVEALP